MWREIKKIIHEKDNFLLTTHVNPDGDGIGAACALTELLLQMGKKVRFVCDSSAPRKFAFLDYHKNHETFDPNSDYSQVQVLIILDAHTKDRIGRLAKIADMPGVTSVCIDHHPATKLFTPFAAIDTSACSSGAMVYMLLQECGFLINIRAATGIYTSVICDTGRFSYSSTNRDAHKIADECMKLGVNPDLMFSRLFQTVSLAQMKMFVKSLQHMETYFNNKVIIQQIFQEDYEKVGNEVIDIEHADLEYFLEFNQLIEDVECVVLLRELTDNQVRVSLRSRVKVDVSNVIKELGGGGHCNAAGVTWKGSLNEVKQLILSLLHPHFVQSQHCEGLAYR